MSKGASYMLAATLCFAIMQVLVKELDLPVAEIIVFRAGISFFLCFFTITINGGAYFGKNYFPLIARGFFGVLSLSCFFYALQNAPLASVVAIVNIKPFLILFIAYFILKEKVSWQQVVFFVISFIGILFVKGFDSRIDNTSILAIIGAATFAAIAHTIVRYLKGRESPNVILFYFTLVTIPCVAPFAYFFWQTPVGIQWLQLLSLGLLTHFGQLFLTKAYQSENMANISNIYFMGIAFAVGFGIFWFGETYSAMVYFGLALIVTGIILNVTRGSLNKSVISSKNSPAK